jgi:DNA-binding phage protein
LVRGKIREKTVLGLFLRPIVTVTASPIAIVLFLTNVFATDDEPFVLHALFVLVSQPRRSEVSECGISIREVETPLQSPTNCERF